MQLCSVEDSAERRGKRRANVYAEQGGGSGHDAATAIVAGTWVIPQKKAKSDTGGLRHEQLERFWPKADHSIGLGKDPGGE
jgi:hypothetical protein